LIDIEKDGIPADDFALLDSFGVFEKFGAEVVTLNNSSYVGTMDVVETAVRNKINLVSDDDYANASKIYRVEWNAENAQIATKYTFSQIVKKIDSAVESGVISKSVAEFVKGEETGVIEISYEPFLKEMGINDTSKENWEKIAKSNIKKFVTANWVSGKKYKGMDLKAFLKDLGI
jgi:hypothetical protein